MSLNLHKHTPEAIFQSWHALLLSDPALAGRLGESYSFRLSGQGGGIWYIRCTPRPEIMQVQQERRAECTISMEAADFMLIVNGELNPQAAFMQGRLKVSGDPHAALKLNHLFDARHDSLN